MKDLSRRLRLGVLALAATGGLWLYLPDFEHFTAKALNPFPIQSSPIVLNAADRFLWVVNPDNDSVSVLDVGGDVNTKVREIPVGDEPQSVALNADNSKVYVANAVSGTVSVISTSNFSVIKQIKVGTEPWALAFTPNGTKLYVANSSSNSVSVIDPATDTVVKTIPNVGIQPRAIAITNDGDFEDNDEKVYVTNFLAQYRFNQIRPADDQGKVGQVYVIRTSTDAVFTTTLLEPIADTGFNSNGSAVPFIPVDPSGAANVKTGAFPNILTGLAIKGDKLYVPATGSSPNGPFKFNSNAQSLVVTVDTDNDADTRQTVNLNREIAPEAEEDIPDLDGNPVPRKRFVTNPYFIAFQRNGQSGYVVSAASDVVFKFDINAAGVPTLTKTGGKIIPILANKNPRAMAINSTDTRGYIWNYVSRDVTVVDLLADRAVDTIVSADQPTSAIQRDIQLGKEFFNSSIGPITINAATGHLEGQLSDRGWLSCASCHPDGLTDAVVWMFPPGPRFTTPLNATFERVPLGQQGNQRALNWTANRDEVEDFELNTRAVAGGRGLIGAVNAQGAFIPDPNVKDLDIPNAGRSADRDAVTTYLRFGIRSPISPVKDNDAVALKGRKLFEKAGCVACHGGPQWTRSTVEFPAPPPANEVVVEVGVGQLVGQLVNVGTFNAADPFELTGAAANLGQQAQGTLGFNTPSLLGIFALGPYLHNGTIVNIDDILDNPAHVGNSPILANPKKRAKLVRFLTQIDDSTPPFP
jgi:YVTN family beta-propeller protein